MKNTIVFLVDVDNEESYGVLASFIYRRENHLDISREDVKRVIYKYYLNNEIESNKEWAQIIYADKKEYRNVKKPENIKNINSKYEVFYCIRVNKDSDIVELYNLYLIKKYYSNLRIMVLFDDYDTDSYFKISQFLYRVNIEDSVFYNSCFFVNGNSIQRLQINSVTFSRRFTPLQIIDKDNLERLFSSNTETLFLKYINKIIKKERIDDNEDADLIEGAVKLLKDTKIGLNKMSKSKMEEIFQGLDIFTFILLCYVMCTMEGLVDISLIERYIFRMREYSSAIQQLAENIVYHSQTGNGVIAIRIHAKNSLYMNRRYNVEKDKNCYNFLEVIVSDFCGREKCKNIAENFISNLSDDNMKQKFGELQPIAFFNHSVSEEVTQTWKEFYQNPENIGKHFGIQIFSSIVYQYNGFFGAESHNGYKNKQGDSFLSYSGNMLSDCMPGTRYHIVFPLEFTQQEIKRQDLSLDSGIGITKMIRDALSYGIGYVNFVWKSINVLTQKDKNKRIIEIADYFRESFMKSKKDIYYVSMNHVVPDMGEVIAKSLVIALFNYKGNVSVVIYQCDTNLKRNIFDALRVFFQNTDLEGMFIGRRLQIILYSKSFEETVVDLSSIHNTNNINAYISHMKCIPSKDWYLKDNNQNINVDEGAKFYIPSDVLYEVDINEKKLTLFEHYTATILNNSIQNNDFGCKLEHTHMRLGSTIHIDEFYEAEILFNNRLFISRFAFLLVKDMREELKNIEKLTLYGYGTYSETVLVQTIEMIKEIYPQKTDIDYIILEREEERRGFLHKDRIRYNRLFSSAEERVTYFSDRKVAIIVLINSTLKTHMRLINLFKNENCIDIENKEWLIRNYAVLLVGNERGNQYWRLEGKRIIPENGTLFPIPQYFIQVHAEYQEPGECLDCFPLNPVAETPLIEVNAASTIPNQAFGILENKWECPPKLEYDRIYATESQLMSLKGKFIYSHVQRNENHFLYYFQTGNLWISEKEKIEDSLRKWKDEWKAEKRLQYNIIVAPMHFSNAGFVESVNKSVFGGNAILLRIDFDKEYRSNAYAKFSYLRNYVEQLASMQSGGVVRVHYVDDVIISGRTFHRAKSLVESVLEVGKTAEHVEIKVFDKVFVLVDRNSMHSRRQYVCSGEEDYYAYIHVNISSLRNYGDSCVFCNLNKEANLLYSTASTPQISKYWKDCTKKFRLEALETFDDEKKAKEARKEEYVDEKSVEIRNKEERAFRRLFCTHMAQCVLEEKNHGNDKIHAIYLILELLNTDYANRKDNKFEYFLSYLKCISRPFLVFKKAVKEAIFDILLVLIDTMVQREKIENVIANVAKEKPYLSTQQLSEKFHVLHENILKDEKVSSKDEQDLVKLLMKQLTELKSNYIIRAEKMDAIFQFMMAAEQEQFRLYYMTLIDRLVGPNSDTNKSIWLDYQIMKKKYNYVDEAYRAWIIIENTRAFRDGVEKFFLKWEASKEFRDASDNRILNLKSNYDYLKAQNMFEEFENKNDTELKMYNDMEDLECEFAVTMKRRIQLFLKSVPNVSTCNFVNFAETLSEENSNWSQIFKHIQKRLCEDVENRDDDEDDRKLDPILYRFINEDTDIYQYSNFFKVLQQDGYISENEVNHNGIDLIVCCTKVVALCRNDAINIWNKVQELATLFKVILDAERVQFIVENKDDNNLDEWKGDIQNKYNQIVEKAEETNSKKGLRKIQISGKKHYTIIAEESGVESYNAELLEETELLLNKLNQQSEKMHNYIISTNHGAVIWKLDNKERSIWIHMKNTKWCNEQEVMVARAVRRVMVFYQELKQKIFNPENDEFINEISHIRKELSIFNSNKVYTHTKDYQQKMQFEQMKSYFENSEDVKENLERYPSYVLNLLADINVSKYYRNGLKKGFYENNREIQKPALWRDFTALLKNESKFVYYADNNEEVTVSLRVDGIQDNDTILCPQNSKGLIKDLMLLIYSLILNAAEQKRGIRNSENCNVQEQCVIVSLYREADCLVIENECEELIDADRINRNLCRVPESEEDGISLWSVNCYIKRCISALVLSKLREIEQDVTKEQYDIKKIEKLGIWITELTGKGCEIQCKNITNDGKNYFKVMVPIFMEKYKWPMEEEGENNE